MILLALEASSAVESAALLDGDRLLAARSWPGDRTHARFLFDALRGLLAETGLAPDRIDAYAAGLGPGSFAGLRMALALLHGMAIPGNAPLHGVASAEAAAAEAARETGCSRILVCGDGRRNRFWSGLFEVREGQPELQGDWRLEPLQDLPALLPRNGAACTADWALLGLALTAAGTARLIPRALCPAAETVARLVLARLRQGRPFPPLVPIYLHPPVFVPPSFPVEDEPVPAQEPA